VSPGDENDRLRELTRDLLGPCVQLINAYAVAEEDGASVDWSDVDQAHEAAMSVVEGNFDLQRCGVCEQYFVPSLTRCGCR
jgi:hypothetical protein